jgi:hypothetical protein
MFSKSFYCRKTVMKTLILKNLSSAGCK